MAKKKYNQDFPLMAEDFARRGMTDVEIAKALGIAEGTLYRYQNEHKEFYEAIKRGKAPVDVEIENKLLKRARGYEYEEVMVEYKPGKIKKEGDDIDKTAEPTLIKKTSKQVVADVTAIIFWLKNRRPDLWKDKHEQVLSGKVTYETSEKFMPKTDNEK